MEFSQLFKWPAIDLFQNMTPALVQFWAPTSKFAKVIDQIVKITDQCQAMLSILNTALV